MLQEASLFNNLVSAKRTKNERQGVYAWHPYYAGYSEAFVRSAIKYLGLNSSDLLLDPWNGSGTTAFVASQFEIPTLGCEINPVMNVFSSAKCSYLIYHKEILINILEKITNLFSIFSTKDNQLYPATIKIHDIERDKDPLLDFMSQSLCNGIRILYLVLEHIDYPNFDISQQLSNNFDRNSINFNPFLDFFKAALFITARQLAGYKGGSNPTWIKNLSYKPEVDKKSLLFHLKKIVNSMIKDLELSSIPLLNEIIHLPLQMDSRRLDIEDNFIDGIITSPPYLTRIDYAMSTKPEILIVSNSEILRQIRENTIGSPVIVDKNIAVNSLWGKTCLQLLNRVKKHRSKAATSYYLPNMLQYFNDAELSLREIIRVLKPNSKALIVVQSSYFKEHEINLGTIYVELCKNLGVRSEIVNREVIRSHLAHINTNSNKYKKKKVYLEDVVCITK